MALAGAGFRAMVAENGVAGLEAFMGMRDEICLAVIDVIMPIMGGQQMAAAVLEKAPDAKVLLMSGYSEAVLTLAGSHEFPFIRKPFLPADFIRKINEILAAGAHA